MNSAAIYLFFERLQKQNPWPTTELIYHTHFELLIAVMLSAQSTDRSVNKATETLFKMAPSPENMLQLGEEKLKNQIKTIGLFNNKAKNIIATCRLLLENFEGVVPNNRKALETLPGVGRKTANVILNTAFNLPTIAVDTHIFRVCNRTQLAPGNTVLAVEQKLMQIVPSKFKRHCHHWLVLHGRYTCTARKPSCSSCIVRDLCPFDA